MSLSDEYVERLEEARVALRAVLCMTEPGTGLDWHATYNSLKKAIERQRATDERPDVARAQANDKRGELPPEWHRETTVREREHEVLAAIGHDRLTIREVGEQLEAAHPDLSVYDSNVRSIVGRLYKANELAREPEHFRGKVRYRYFRRSTLDGPIADLDRAFREQDGL